jgi:hypothetical protein
MKDKVRDLIEKNSRLATKRNKLKKRRTSQEVLRDWLTGYLQYYFNYD